MTGLALRPAALALLAALAAGCASSPEGASWPSTTRPSRIALQGPPPAILPPAASAGGSGLLGGPGWSADQADVDWGVGALVFTRGMDGLTRASLPLFDGPGGTHWGWLTQGRAYAIASRSAGPLRPEALARGPDGSPAMIVLEARRDGWLKLRWGAPEDVAGGEAWTRLDFGSGSRPEYRSWGQLLGSAFGLVFRNSEVAHNLRASPSRDGAILAALPGEGYDMTVLLIRGDWMRVRINAPPLCSAAAPDATGLLGAAGAATPPRDYAPPAQEGWIAWRSDARGPWVKRASGCGAPGA